MKLIIGLGNPGKEYQNNRHNIGFMALEKIIQKIPLLPLISLNKLCRKQHLGAAIVEATVNKQKILLAAPQRFINNSGQVVADLMKYYNLKPNDILVLSDDLQINFGTVRIRRSGGAGGHNGLASIIDQIGGDFWRIRIGIKNELVKDPGDWHDFVLSDFIFEEKKKLPKILDSAADLVIKWIEQDMIGEQTLQVNAEQKIENRK